MCKATIYSLSNDGIKKIDYYETDRMLSFVDVVQQVIGEREESRPVKIPMQDVIQEARAVGLSNNVLLNEGLGRMGSRLRAEAAYVGLDWAGSV